MTDSAASSVNEVLVLAEVTVQDMCHKLYGVTDTSLQNIKTEVRQILENYTAKFRLEFLDSEGKWIVLTDVAIKKDTALKTFPWKLRVVDTRKSQEEEEEEEEEEPVLKKIRVKGAGEIPKYPRRPATWRPFMNELSEVVPGTGVWAATENHKKLEAISCEESLEVLESHFTSAPVAWVIGAPGCGKTSLGNMFLARMQGKGWTVEIRSSSAVSTQFMHTFYEDHARGPDGLRTNAKVLLIIDECQAIEAWEMVDSLFIKNRPIKLLLLGTDHPQKAQSKHTPETLGKNKFWMFAPTLERGAISQFLQSALDLHGVRPSSLRERWCNSIFDVCGGNLDMVLTSMRLLIQTGDYPTTHNLLKAKPRTVANGGEDWEQAKVELAQKVCAVGATSVGRESKGRELVRRGFLMPVRTELVASSALVKAKPGDYDELTWATALQRDYAVICQNVSPLPTKQVQTAGLQKPLDLLLRLLPMVDVDFLVICDVAGTGVCLATEYHIQAALLVAASKVCPKGTFLNEWPVEDCRVDFLYIHDDENRWGIEITRNGTRLDEHTMRFSDGPYKDACSDWVVVDFWTKPTSSLPPTEPKVVRISPHPCMGWDAFVLSFGRQSVCVPRNGVPQYLTSQMKVEPCVEIMGKPGPSQVWVQCLHLECGDEAKKDQFSSVGDAFMVTDNPTNIHFLKNSIANYKRCHADLIAVYLKEEGAWRRLRPDEEVVPGNTIETSYGYIVETNSM